MRTRKTDAIAVVESAYDLDESGGDELWARGVLDAFRPLLDRGLGVGMYLSDMAASQPFVAGLGRGLPDGWERAMQALLQSPGGGNLLNPRKPAMTASDSIGRQALAKNEVMRRAWRPIGIADGAGVVAADGTGRLVSFFAPMPTVGSIRRDVAARFGQLAAHVSAGWRLRRCLEKTPAAVLTPDGKTVHAVGEARETSARAKLRHAAIAVDRARGRMRRTDPDAALSLWHVLVDGRWSLVDEFESDGKRYLIARENEPSVRDPRALEPRERQVLALTAMGHAVKLIAYELGLSSPTVSELRKRAMRKLKLTSYADIARLFARPSGAC